MKATQLMIVAVGGQGNILAARVLGEAALAADMEVRMSEFHGMAQRGGVVESMVLMGEGKSYCIADGDADVLLAFEPSEAVRSAGKCHKGSVIITNTAPVPPYTVALGKTQYPDTRRALEILEGRVRKLIAFDATALAVKAGSPLSLNMVMLGALAKSGAIDLSADLFMQVIREKTKKTFIDTNLKAFEFGMEAA
ncbi:MAG: pyruvate ferredoxin oxidoreductase [Desulfobulbaceae bacterium BRH_c16a]|nr:MAG: pyruvate ferredoxin oxidoreductase [Desulfobulbaceae bacterium BRH_c16a]